MRKGRLIYFIDQEQRHDAHGTPIVVDTSVAFAPETSANMRKAITVYNMCIMSVIVYFPELQKALQALGAQVSCHEVLIDPAFMLALDGKLMRPWHHVLCVKTADGQEYIADFTIEQFGYFDHWFLEKSVYLDVCAASGSSEALTAKAMASVKVALSQGHGELVMAGFQSHLVRNRAAFGLYPEPKIISDPPRLAPAEAHRLSISQTRTL